MTSLFVLNLSSNHQRRVAGRCSTLKHYDDGLVMDALSAPQSLKGGHVHADLMAESMPGGKD